MYFGIIDLYASVCAVVKLHFIIFCLDVFTAFELACKIERTVCLLFKTCSLPNLRDLPSFSALATVYDVI